jgi:lipopolysaccharide heptosyltransferase II
VKILVRATNWVGDAILALPALQAIRAREPNAQISILGRRWVAALYRGQGIADELLVLEDAPDPAALLRSKHFDAAILLQNAFHAAWLTWRAGIPHRIGYARDGRSFLLTQPVVVPAANEIPAHESYYYLELLRRAGWLDKLPQVANIRLHVETSERDVADKRLLDAGVRKGVWRIAIAPGAAYGSAKCWPPQRFASLADTLIDRFNADVILFGAPSERDITARIASEMRHRPVNFAGQTTIDQLPAHFAVCDLFIGNDSGAMHVAAAVGMPVVAIFGPTDPYGTAPVTDRLDIVRNAPSCSPCFLRHCPVDHRCMTRIEVDAVLDAARKWIQHGPEA